jgi:hypothetical protein
MPIAFRNKMSKCKKEYRITDYASTEVAVAIPDSKVLTIIHGCVMQKLNIGCNGTENERLWYSRSAETVLGGMEDL